MSFDEVYTKHYHELKRFGRHLNIPVDKCDDLTQEVFLRFYIETKENIVFNNPRAWLYKVFMNLFKNQINTGNRELNSPERWHKTEEPMTDFQDEYAIKEKQQIVLGMLDKLSKREKEILLLYHNGFSYSEMAEILEINPKSVGKTLVRAIESLKETLKIQYHEMFE
jgi:RNA polymerase sigma-70 factor, ECF subfamily